MDKDIKIQILENNISFYEYIIKIRQDAIKDFQDEIDKIKKELRRLKGNA